jgi:hypothetical protein
MSLTKFMVPGPNYGPPGKPPVPLVIGKSKKESPPAEPENASSDDDVQEVVDLPVAPKAVPSSSSSAKMNGNGGGTSKPTDVLHAVTRVLSPDGACGGSIKGAVAMLKKVLGDQTTLHAYMGDDVKKEILRAALQNANEVFSGFAKQVEAVERALSEIESQQDATDKGGEDPAVLARQLEDRQTRVKTFLNEVIDEMESRWKDEDEIEPDARGKMIAILHNIRRYFAKSLVDISGQSTNANYEITCQFSEMLLVVGNQQLTAQGYVTINYSRVFRSFSVTMDVRPKGNISLFRGQGGGGEKMLTKEQMIETVAVKQAKFLNKRFEACLTEGCRSLVHFAEDYWALLFGDQSQKKPVPGVIDLLEDSEYRWCMAFPVFWLAVACTPGAFGVSRDETRVYADAFFMQHLTEAHCGAGIVSGLDTSDIELKDAASREEREDRARDSKPKKPKNAKKRNGDSKLVDDSAEREGAEHSSDDEVDGETEEDRAFIVEDEAEAMAEAPPSPKKPKLAKTLSLGKRKPQAEPEKPKKEAKEPEEGEEKKPKRLKKVVSDDEKEEVVFTEAVFRDPKKGPPNMIEQRTKQAPSVQVEQRLKNPKTQQVDPLTGKTLGKPAVSEPKVKHSELYDQ